MNLDNIRIVLVNTTHPGNIGGVARAMKNMGFQNLVLVAPKRFPHEQATWRSVGADDLLANAQITDTLEEALADCHYVVGTSARGRRIPWPILDPKGCAKRVEVESVKGQVAIIFGREDRGLKNEELQQCHLHVHIPSCEDYSSLNLAMAVQIICYEVRMLLLEPTLSADELDQWDVELGTMDNLERFYEHLEQTLVDIGFLDRAVPRQLMVRLRRLYSRVRMDEIELNILRGILSETQHWAKKAKSLEKSE
jgi:tRNA (cytidine32/uridine32-2'-O)-methyltransferase